MKLSGQFRLIDIQNQYRVGTHLGDDWIGRKDSYLEEVICMKNLLFNFGVGAICFFFGVWLTQAKQADESHNPDKETETR